MHFSNQLDRDAAEDTRPYFIAPLVIENELRGPDFNPDYHYAEILNKNCGSGIEEAKQETTGSENSPLKTYSFYEDNKESFDQLKNKKDNNIENLRLNYLLKVKKNNKNYYACLGLSLQEIE